MTDAEPSEPADQLHDPPPTLTMWDSVSIIVGIVVGVSIFKVPGLIFSQVSTPLEGLFAWAIGAVVGLCGALTYAELATMHRRSGGEYVFLSQAYGPCFGFLFGWAQLTGVFSGSIGSMAYVFSDYALASTSLDASFGVVLASLSVVVLTTLHILGVRIGKTVQNVFTGAKLLGLGILLLIGMLAETTESLTIEMTPGEGGFGLAMILILYAYGGWNDAAMISSEVKESQRNVPRAFVIGLLLIGGLYLLVNMAYVRGLGFEAIRDSGTPATDLVANSQLVPASLREGSTLAIAVLVMTSALGAVHGLIFTGSRLYAALGSDHILFAKLGRWNPRLGSPVWALVAQAGLTVLLIATVGSGTGRGIVDDVAVAVGRSAVPWEKFRGGFQTLLAATAPVFWTFFLLSGVSVFVFRWKMPDADRPFRTPLFPVVPAVFCLSCVYMIYSSVTYAGDLSLLALVPLACGLPVFFVSSRLGQSSRKVSS